MLLQTSQCAWILCRGEFLVTTESEILFCQGAKDKASPFCTGSPINTLAEPEDLVIVCGEFNSGVQIVSQSFENEEVFTVKKITNHPRYNPKRVGKLIFDMFHYFSNQC